MSDNRENFIQLMIIAIVGSPFLAAFIKMIGELITMFIKYKFKINSKENEEKKGSDDE